MLDFLKEIVENVPDPTNGGAIAEKGADGDGKKRKRTRGKAKAKKEETEEERTDEGDEQEDD